MSLKKGSKSLFNTSHILKWPVGNEAAWFFGLSGNRWKKRKQQSRKKEKHKIAHIELNMGQSAM